MGNLIDKDSAKSLAEQFRDGLKGEVDVILFVSDIITANNPQQEEINTFARQLMQELHEIEPRIKYRETGLLSEEAQALGVTVSPSIAVGYHEGYRILYSGAPLGHEAGGFVDVLLAVSAKKSGLSAESEKMLAEAVKPVNIKVFVTPTCPYCPHSVSMASRMAIAAKGKVTAVCVESMENQDLAAKFNVSSVPQQVINDDPASITIGQQKEKDFVLQVMKYSAPEKYEAIAKETETMAKTKEKLADSPAGTVYITDNNLDEALKKYENLIVDCWAEWCMPCKMLGPVIDELAKENAGKIVFGKINVDDNPNKARQYGIMSIPTLLVFKKGIKKGEIVGALPKAELLRKINELLK